jgi:hypothetical protein
MILTFLCILHCLQASRYLYLNPLSQYYLSLYSSSSTRTDIEDRTGMMFYRHKICQWYSEFMGAHGIVIGGDVILRTNFGLHVVMVSILFPFKPHFAYPTYESVLVR